MDRGHWNYAKGDFHPDSYVGFVYRITNLATSQSYIGKKLFWSTTRKTIKGRKNKKLIKTESNWKSYTSSSKQLNADILNLGLNNFQFDIISLHETKSALSFAETKAQWELDVMRSKLPCGKPAYYNGRIEPIRWSKETADKILFT